MTRSELIEALKSAKGPFEEDAAFNMAYGSAFIPEGIRYMLTHALGSQVTALGYAISLVERVRPDVNCYGFDKTPNETTAYVSRNHVKEGHWLKEASGATPALALLIALLSSMED